MIGEKTVKIMNPFTIDGVKKLLGGHVLNYEGLDIHVAKGDIFSVLKPFPENDCGEEIFSSKDFIEILNFISKASFNVECLPVKKLRRIIEEGYFYPLGDGYLGIDTSDQYFEVFEPVRNESSELMFKRVDGFQLLQDAISQSEDLIIDSALNS